MSLQKFKLNIANSVVNADNSSMSAMNLDGNELLDLFTLQTSAGGASGGGSAAAAAEAGAADLDTGGMMDPGECSVSTHAGISSAQSSSPLAHTRLGLVFYFCGLGSCSGCGGGREQAQAQRWWSDLRDGGLGGLVG